MDLPTVLYRCPGPHSRAGGTWDYKGVETVEAHEAATAEGWQATLPDAIEAYEGKRAEVMAEVEKEVEQEAKADAKADEKADEPLKEVAAPAKPAKGKPGRKPKAKG